jgi:hypothetical protein
MPLTRTALCPVLRPALAAAGLSAPQPIRPPRPEGLAYSFTIPGEVHCAAIARTTIRSALSAHGLSPYADSALLAATELIGTAAQLTPREDIYLSLRYRVGGLRLVVWDQHPRHRDHDAVALCEERRLGSLWLLAAVAEDSGGDWGVAEAVPPHRGTKSWILLPRLDLLVM